MESKLRKTDECCADIVSSFLYDKFYNTTKEFSRIYDKMEQFKGIDTTFIFNNEKYICDEKAAIRYVNKHLGTFSLELSFLNRKGIETIGWFLDDTKVNNSYLFCWIDKAEKNILTDINDIKELEIALVKKDKINNFLDEIGWNKQNLLIKCQNIRTNPNEYLGNFYKNGCKFSKSFQLVEKPINILIKRDKLIELSDFTKIFR
jgi:hypothetical protein